MESSSNSLTSKLAELRYRAEMTQSQIANRLQCRQAKVSKIERGQDADLSFGDIVAYVEATGYRLEILLQQAQGTPIDELKTLAVRMNACFDQLAKQSTHDRELALTLTEFYQKALENLITLVANHQDLISRSLETGCPNPERLPSVTIHLADKE